MKKPIKDLRTHLKEKNWDFAKSWIESNNPIHAQNNIILYELMRQNNVDFFNWLIERGNPIFKGFKEFHDPLKVAVERNNHEIIEQSTNFYITHERNENVPLVSIHATLLAIFVDYGYIKGIKSIFGDYFKEHKSKNEAGREFLKKCIHSPKIKNEILRLEIFDYIASFNIPLNKNSVLSNKKDLLIEASSGKRLLIAEYLIGKGLDFNWHQQDAVRYAISNDDTKMLQLFVDKGLCLKKIQPYVEVAIKENALETVKFLENLGGDIYCKESLKCAVISHKTKDVLMYLLNKVSMEDLKDVVNVSSPKIKPIIANMILENELVQKESAYKKMKV